MQFSLRQLFCAIVVFSIIMWAGLYLRSVVAPRIVASVDHPNGTRLRVVQKFEYNGDLFNSSIYFDDGDGQWRWYYFDHDDSYWNSATAEVIGNEIQIESTNRMIRLDTMTGKCRLLNQEVGDRTFPKSTQIVSLPDGISD